MNNYEWSEEIKWLEIVLKEALKQLEEKRKYIEMIRKENIDIQRELWNDIGNISSGNNLEQIVDFMAYINMIKAQKRTYNFIKQQEEKYEKIVSSPYFGRIDFVEDGSHKAEKYYIGMANLINDNYDILVYDWRAPVSSMFYDYEIGEASYKCPEGIIKGKVTLKRQYKVTNGKLEYMFDSNLKIDDEILQEVLGKTTDSKMKTIVTSIQREQNKVIRNEEYKNLIVQGPAGSGKTSVALHRVAYLLYKYRDKIAPENIIIFSPNKIFNDYISNVLPQLGEENILQTTFKEYMHKALGEGLKKEDYYDMMEYILSSKDRPSYNRRINNIRFKSSVEFAEKLKKYVEYIDSQERNYSDIYFRDKLVISADELNELYHKDYSNLPLKKRLKKMGQRISFLLKPHEEERMQEIISELSDNSSYTSKSEINRIAKSRVKDEIKDIYAEIERISRFDIVDIYKQFIEKLEYFWGNSENNSMIEDIKKYTLENLNVGQIYYEDQIPLLYLKEALGDLPGTSEIKYVIIDEAQDYTLLQYEIFHKLFSHASITMLGDLNQSINPYMNVGDYNNISHIFPKDNTCIMNLTKSYRSTIEIAKFTRKILKGENTDELFERSGDKPIVLGFDKEEDIINQICEDIKTYRDKGYKSIGIITRTKAEANEVYRNLKDRIRVRAIVDDDEEYMNDAVVMPAYLAKGLEFDVVLIYNAGNGNYCCEEERLLLYTACTRALHVLCVYYTGNLTPLLEHSME